MNLYSVKQGQAVYSTEVIDKLNKQKNILKTRQTNLHTENRQTEKYEESLHFGKKTFL